MEVLTFPPPCSTVDNRGGHEVLTEVEGSYPTGAIGVKVWPFSATFLPSWFSDLHLPSRHQMKHPQWNMKASADPEALVSFIHINTRTFRQLFFKVGPHLPSSIFFFLFLSIFIM